MVALVRTQGNRVAAFANESGFLLSDVASRDPVYIVRAQRESGRYSTDIPSCLHDELQAIAGTFQKGK